MTFGLFLLLLTIAGSLGAQRAADASTIVALANGGRQLVVFDADGAVRDRYELGATKHFWFGPTIAYDAPNHRVLAAAVDSLSKNTRVVALDLVSRQLRTLALIQDSVGYPLVDVGQRTGRVYVISDVGVRAVVLDGTTGTVVDRVNFLRDDERWWLVMGARVSSTESRLYVSYHGGCSPTTLNVCSTGLDWVELDTTKSACRADAKSLQSGCLVMHGEFLVTPEKIVGASQNGLAEFDLAGRVLRRHTVGLSQHFMYFAVDGSARKAYAPSSCRFGTGVTTIQLGVDSAAMMLPDSRARSVCGKRAVVSTDGSSLGVFGEQRGLFLIDLREAGQIRAIPFTAVFDDVVMIGPISSTAGRNP